ncbi:hypothetical protein RhiirC2_834795 [Rhizophagus irregularis]|uniref:Uncharacterized protein n=1 Tax=Rhizophagus irregularis TaxID=588596 RepID=A0A2N1N1V8_9GLOM|nr:hypothetical protein RhiirC2_834795 [Rhizophagus irregularis]
MISGLRPDVRMKQNNVSNRQILAQGLQRLLDLSMQDNLQWYSDPGLARSTVQSGGRYRKKNYHVSRAEHDEILMNLNLEHNGSSQTRSTGTRRHVNGKREYINEIRPNGNSRKTNHKVGKTSNATPSNEGTKIAVCKKSEHCNQRLPFVSGVPTKY